MGDPRVARRWASRAVLTAAVIASIATSRPRWHLDALMPEHAVVTTSPGGTEAIVFSIEASQQPEYVSCSFPGTTLTLAPVAGTPAWDTSASPPPPRIVHQQYVCPPGGTLVPMVLYGNGHSSGCSSPEPPDDAFFRVTKIGVAKVWSRTVDQRVTLRASDYAANVQELSVIIGGTGQAVLSAQLESVGGAAVPPVSVSAGANGVWNILATTATEHAPPLVARLHATVYGPCPSAGPCEPPSAARPPTIEPRP